MLVVVPADRGRIRRWAGVGGAAGAVAVAPAVRRAAAGATARGWRRGRRRERDAAEIDEGAGRHAGVIRGDIDLDAGHPIVLERGGDGQRAPVSERQRVVPGLGYGHGRSVDHQIPQPQVDGWDLADRGLRNREMQAAQRQLAAKERGALDEDLARCGRIGGGDGAPRVRHLHGGCVGGGLPGGRPGRCVSGQLGRRRDRDRAIRPRSARPGTKPARSYQRGPRPRRSLRRSMPRPDLS